MTKETKPKTSTKTASNFVPTEAEKRIAEIHFQIQEILDSVKNPHPDIMQDLHTELKFLQQQKEAAN